MASDRMPMTPAGLVRLKEELKRLKGVERPRIVKEIAEARSHGDLSENAEYHAAKEKQSHVEGRIQQVEHWIATAEVIDVSKHQGDRIVFGHWSTLGYRDGDNVWALDSGCLWGGALTAIRLDDDPMRPIQLDCAGYLAPGGD